MFHPRRRPTDEEGHHQEDPAERSKGFIGRRMSRSSSRSPPPPPSPPPRPRPQPQSPSDAHQTPPVVVEVGLPAHPPRTPRRCGGRRRHGRILPALIVVLAHSLLLPLCCWSFSGRQQRPMADAAGTSTAAFLPPPPPRIQGERRQRLDHSARGRRYAPAAPSFAAVVGGSDRRGYRSSAAGRHQRDFSWRPSGGISQRPPSSSLWAGITTTSSSTASPRRNANRQKTSRDDLASFPAGSPAESTSSSAAFSLSFSHLHLYADHVDDVSSYKSLEDDLNEFAAALRKGEEGGEASSSSFDDGGGKMKGGRLDVARCRSVWRSIVGGDGDGDDGAAAADAASDDASEGATTFVGQDRDVVRQLIAGLGFRVTGCRMPGYGDGEQGGAIIDTRSVLVTSPDPGGVQFVITAPAGDDEVDMDESGGDDGGKEGDGGDGYGHFDASNLRRFSSCHGGRQGVAVLAFHVQGADPCNEDGGASSQSLPSSALEEIYKRYAELHPNLLVEGGRRGDVDLEKATPLGIQRYDDADILEVYAYYRGEVEDEEGDEEERDAEGAKDAREADRGTVLRFMQSKAPPSSPSDGSQPPSPPLPGLTSVPATFDGTSQPAYCDHWVSNVFSRTGFISTLSDTLGFAPKVNFNAGVVAAGESQIESTVTGNASPFVTSSPAEALRDQSQVYLPINNALSPVGHVHGFLRELGQGVQHVASRVDDLVGFVQRGNDYRRITGEGLAFLNIPRSYYGVLSAETLAGDAAVSTGCARAVVEACCCRLDGGIATTEGAVHLDLSEEDVGTILDGRAADADADSSFADPRHVDEYRSNRSDVVRAVLRSRYANLSDLLGDRLSEETYLGIVRNQILVDVQGNDLLFQIFTGNVMQRHVGEESPFLEFIQRVCAEPTTPSPPPSPEGGGVDGAVRFSTRNDNNALIKPGCGGFGIRNFLTLFLSIEVSKAMTEAARAGEAGDEARRVHFRRVVDIFTDQLNESNPILTDIADAMTAEGEAEAEVRAALGAGDEEAAAMWRGRVRAAAEAKEVGNERLMVCSEKYKSIMRKFREESVVK